LQIVEREWNTQSEVFDENSIGERNSLIALCKKEFFYLSKVKGGGRECTVVSHKT